MQVLENTDVQQSRPERLRDVDAGAEFNNEEFIVQTA